MKKKIRRVSFEYDHGLFTQSYTIPYPLAEDCESFFIELKENNWWFLGVQCRV